MGFIEVAETVGAFVLLLGLLVLWGVLFVVQTLAIACAVVFVAIARLTRVAADAMRS